MKDYPKISVLKFNIKVSNNNISEMQALMPAIQQELRTWQAGTKAYEKAAAEKADLLQRIKAEKKTIAASQKLLKHPEVLRRHHIYRDVEGILDVMMPDLDSPHYVSVFIGAEVQAETNTDYDYGYYAKSYGHPKKIQNPVVTVLKDWDTAIQSRGLALLGGMLTLSAKPAKKQKEVLQLADKVGVELYEAVWVRNRGFQLRTETGFIAVKRTSLGVLPHTAYHSESPKKAVNGAYRKYQNSDYNLPLEKRDVPADATATWSDAHAVGACESGVKNWCDSVGIDYKQESVPLIDVVRGYYAYPLPEAKAIILRVLKQYPAVKTAA